MAHTTKYRYVLDPPRVGKTASGTIRNMDAVWQELSDLCKAYPNLWFIVEDTQVAFSASIRNGTPDRFFGPKGTFETTMRGTYHGTTNCMMGTLYVRYVG